MAHAKDIIGAEWSGAGADRGLGDTVFVLMKGVKV
jgi:hypothetical protein